jgi:hypothetical protein
MFDRKALIFEFVPIYRRSAGAITSCKVATLDHEAFDNPMEVGPFRRRLDFSLGQSSELRVTLVV